MMEVLTPMAMNNNQYYDRFKRDKGSRTFYRSNAWHTARTSALIRDNYLCQDCYDHERITPADMVHHIKELRDYPHLALDVDNLRSLCNPCHNKHHARGKEEKKVSNKIKIINSDKNPEVF